MNQHKSGQLYYKAKAIFPGGVNSPVRAFKSVGLSPFYVKAGKGPYVIDEDNNVYIDYVMGWGSVILGHAHAKVTEAVVKTINAGIPPGTCHRLEIELAEKIIRHIPSIEMLRFVNSGTEAVMSAIRLARAATGRDKIIKFEGCYHGHADFLLVKAGSGLATYSIPSSSGVPQEFSRNTLVAHYNNLQSVKELFEEHGEEIACVIVEPIAGNMGVVVPDVNFLRGLRELCDRYGALLIFDEVITGFRVHMGGAQTLYDIKPDITVLGKVIGGGLPVGAYGGSRYLMKHISPEGTVYQAGTLSSSAVAMSAGLAVLSELESSYDLSDLFGRTEYLAKELNSIFRKAGIDAVVVRAGAMFSIFFSCEPPESWEDVEKSNTDMYSAWFRKMLSKGVFLPPSPYEACFLSFAHDEKVIEKTLEVADESTKELVQEQ